MAALVVEFPGYLIQLPFILSGLTFMPFGRLMNRNGKPVGGKATFLAGVALAGVKIMLRCICLGTRIFCEKKWVEIEKALSHGMCERASESLFFKLKLMSYGRAILSHIVRGEHTCNTYNTSCFEKGMA
ncbi:MAG: hypothetical protein IPM36_04075 [Lewinellaceae bacterium]|nr:hypothetical protein [Lewinellaceae bacterium]